MQKLFKIVILLFLLDNLINLAVAQEANVDLSSNKQSSIKSWLEDTNQVIEIDLYIENHRFYPEIIEVPTGRKIRITVHNQDDTIEEFESFDLKREKIIFAKAKGVVILAPLKAGEYKFFGEFYEETAQGKIIAVEKKQGE